MDYTSIPRSLFYKEKTDLSIFTRNRSKNSLEYQFFKKLKQFIKDSIKAPENAQKVLNNACYICSLIYHQDESSLYFYRYLKIAERGFEDELFRNELKAITIALVYNWLNTSWFKNEKAVMDGGIEEIEEIMEDIYVHYNMLDPFPEVEEWIKKVFFDYVFDVDLFYSNMRFSDISCRPIRDAIEDIDVSIIDVVKGIDYICDSAFHEGKNELFVLSHTLNRLKNEANGIEEVVGASIKEAAFNKVENRLRALEQLPEESEKGGALIQSIEELKREISEKDQMIKEMDEELAIFAGKAESWEYQFREAEENRKKAENERDLLQNILNGKPSAKKYTTRQAAIIAFALCQKGGFIPKNKKNIATLFHDLTGFSANTLGQNLCASYKDDEIEEVAQSVEKDMLEFAQYLREKTFYLPEKKK